MKSNFKFKAGQLVKDKEIYNILLIIGRFYNIDDDVYFYYIKQDNGGNAGNMFIATVKSIDNNFELSSV